MGSDDNLLEKISGTRVLVVGDVMLDRYWFGDVDRISPEAPVPVVAVRKNDARLGGAANVAVNISSLGGACTLLGIVGSDSAAKELDQIVEDNDIVHGLVQDKEMPTSIKQRVISRNQQLLRADFEGIPSDEAVQLLQSQSISLLQQHDVLILSDYGKGSLSNVEPLIQVATNKNVPVLVDPKGSDFSRYCGAHLITPNLKELESVTGPLEDDKMMAEKAKSLLSQYNLGGLLVTLSERGMKLFEQDKPPLHSPARSREVYDVSGAGDTVIAILAMCKGADVPAEDALRIANSAAGVVVSKLGTATATVKELSAAMKRDLS